MKNFKEWMVRNRRNPYVRMHNIRSEEDLINLAKEFKDLTNENYEAIYDLASLDGTDTDYVLDVMNYLNESSAKVGDTIEIVRMNDDNGRDIAATRMAGKIGKVKHIDGRGQLHGTWGSLAVIPEEDEFRVLSEGLDEYIIETPGLRAYNVMIKFLSTKFMKLYGEVFDSWDEERWLDICDDVWGLEDEEFNNEIIFDSNEVRVINSEVGDFNKSWTHDKTENFDLKYLTKIDIVANRLVMWFRDIETYIVSNKLPANDAKSIQKLIKSSLYEGECCGCQAGAVYNTPMNTIGIGDPVPAGFNSLGSGDKFPTIGFGMATKASPFPKRPRKKHRKSRRHLR